MTVTATRSDRSVGAEEPEPRATAGARPVQSPPPPPAAPALSGHVERTIAAGVVAAARSARDRVLYVGMNAEGGQRHVEAGALRQMRRGDVDVVGHGEDDSALGPDHVRIAALGGQPRVVDLGTPDGARAFAASLGLPPAQTAHVALVLGAARPGSRDELAGIAAVFARGERGEPMPGRLVLSGHSVGDGVYDGRDSGHLLRYADVFALAKVMKAAAAKVEHVMLSACSSGYGAPVAGEWIRHTLLPEWSTHFPNLRTAWGYGGGADSHSPSGGDAVQHIGAWNRSARGEVRDLDAAKVARGLAYAQNIATWSSAGDYRPGRP